MGEDCAKGGTLKILLWKLFNALNFSFKIKPLPLSRKLSWPDLIKHINKNNQNNLFYEKGWNIIRNKEYNYILIINCWEPICSSYSEQLDSVLLAILELRCLELGTHIYFNKPTSHCHYWDNHYEGKDSSFSSRFDDQCHCSSMEWNSGWICRDCSGRYLWTK